MSPTQPAQMPPGGWDRPVATPPPLAPLAGWWSRVGATLVDAVVILVPAFVLGGVIFAQQLAQVYLRRGSKKRVAAQG